MQPASLPARQFRSGLGPQRPLVAQGRYPGPARPYIANLYLHYTFDMWMRRNFPGIPFQRYADDTVCHCRSKAQADLLKAALERRFAECGLELHPEKTKTVYCKDDGRREDFPTTRCDFLGYTFRPRRVRRRRGRLFVGFNPGVSQKAAKAIRQEVRDWRLPRRTDRTLHDLSEMFTATIRGWVNYYGTFRKSALYPTLRQIDRALANWARRKYKRLRGHRRRADQRRRRIARHDPELFAHWQLLYGQACLRKRMREDTHVRF